MLRFWDIHLNEKGQRDVIEHVLTQPCQGVIRQVLEQLRFLRQIRMLLKVIGQLFRIGMKIWVDKVA